MVKPSLRLYLLVASLIVDITILCSLLLSVLKPSSIDINSLTQIDDYEFIAAAILWNVVLALELLRVERGEEGITCEKGNGVKVRAGTLGKGTKGGIVMSQPYPP